MHERFQDEAVRKTVDAIQRMCKGNSPCRGDFEAPLVALLTQSDLERPMKTKLLEALAALGGKDGKVSDETIASTATVALEREYRFLPLPGQPGYQESINYQKKLLEVIKRCGNREIGPAMDFFKQNHTGDEIKRLAGEAKRAVEARADQGSQRILIVE
jgi:hypothetical protein